ncbi:MAG TPA: glycosyltransferase [Bacteroidia bacterium]|jgi:hypothetical protein|nr:glycosyltransferase [Bacteroidia bacterium]
MALRILVSPLDWGLGHATRCIPIIKHLLDSNIEVVLAADGYGLVILREEFPSLDFVELKGYRVWYSSFLPAGAAIALQVPKINRAIAREHRELESIISTKNINAVISDNRYGLYTDKVPCIIITHQLNIQSPFAKGSLRAKVMSHVQKFNACWIPDYEEGDDLSGSLSHPLPNGLNAHYMGILSRFESRADRKEMKYDLLVLLSGPEPQRTILEKKVIKQVKEIGNLRVLVVQGKPGATAVNVNDRIQVVPYLNKNELLENIVSSKAILARPGYTTLMDLAVIGGKRAIFIPTPGQTEQEYLAMYLESEEIAVSFSQSKFSLKEAWRKVFATKGFNNALYKPVYKHVIDEWVKTI